MVNEGSGEASPSAVGIFWVLVEQGESPQALADLVPVHQGERYDEFLTHGGHYEFWERLAGLGAPELRRRGFPTAVLWSEYEEWPRGRVVFHQPTGRFIVYVDRKLRSRPILGLVLARFGLRAQDVELRGDPHYVSVRPLL